MYATGLGVVGLGQHAGLAQQGRELGVASAALDGGPATTCACSFESERVP